jgi:hypothetical protein
VSHPRANSSALRTSTSSTPPACIRCASASTLISWKPARARGESARCKPAARWQPRGRALLRSVCGQHAGGGGVRRQRALDDGCVVTCQMRPKAVLCKAREDARESRRVLAAMRSSCSLRSHGSSSSSSPASNTPLLGGAEREQRWSCTRRDRRSSHAPSRSGTSPSDSRHASRTRRGWPPKRAGRRPCLRHFTASSRSSEQRTRDGRVASGFYFYY